MFDGVYTHNFTEAEIASSLEGYEERGYTPYNVTENSNYLYMIRETGGFMTGHILIIAIQMKLASMNITIVTSVMKPIYWNWVIYQILMI